MSTTWDVPLFVTLDDRTRRAIARRLGKRGLISRHDFEDVVGELVGEWVAETVAEHGSRRSRTKGDPL